MGLLPRRDRSDRVAVSDEDTAWAPSAGEYLTNGATLFCVGHTLSDLVSGELILELEDCGTLDLVLCPVRTLTALGLRSVAPAIAA